MTLTLIAASSYSFAVAPYNAKLTCGGRIDGVNRFGDLQLADGKGSAEVSPGVTVSVEIGNSCSMECVLYKDIEVSLLGTKVKASATTSPVALP